MGRRFVGRTRMCSRLLDSRKLYLNLSPLFYREEIFRKRDTRSSNFRSIAAAREDETISSRFRRFASPFFPSSRMECSPRARTSVESRSVVKKISLLRASLLRYSDRFSSIRVLLRCFLASHHRYFGHGHDCWQLYTPLVYSRVQK